MKKELSSIWRSRVPAVVLLVLVVTATAATAATTATAATAAEVPGSWLSEIWSVILDWLDPDDGMSLGIGSGEPPDSMGFEIEPNG